MKEAKNHKRSDIGRLHLLEMSRREMSIERNELNGCLGLGRDMGGKEARLLMVLMDTRVWGAGDDNV